MRAAGVLCGALCTCCEVGVSPTHKLRLGLLEGLARLVSHDGADVVLRLLRQLIPPVSRACQPSSGTCHVLVHPESNSDWILSVLCLLL